MLKPTGVIGELRDSYSQLAGNFLLVFLLRRLPEIVALTARA